MTTSERGTANVFATDSLVQLEFAKVVKLVVGKTQTPYGKLLAEGLMPLHDHGRILQALRETEEARLILQEDGPLRLGSGDDLLPHLETLHTEGLRLEPEVLRDVRSALESASETRQQLFNSEHCSLLIAFAKRLTPIPELAAEIRRSIGQHGEILDTASFELADLRHNIKKERTRVKRQLEKLLQDESLQGVFQESLMTDRNGRYVVPVRADHSGRLKGFVHDVSASGQTLYLEPASTLESNNRIQTTLHKIAREEERILASLTAGVRKVRKELAENQAVLAHLDLRQAIARLTVEMDAIVPELTEKPCLGLLDARHPLLVAAKLADSVAPSPVPVDVRLAEECQALIISGPNTGGKTVALKTAGLLVLMVRAGMPIPCASGSRLFPFSRVMTDIGDEQSIEASLSTYSGHLMRWRKIIENADETTLVLMDELGTGTDPGEGSALALATVDYLRSTGARVLATTHLHVVKGYAQLEERVENAAVEFDTETLQPTFRLHYGIPGASHAFTIARRIGLPESLLQNADGYLDQDERSGGAIIERLQSLRAVLDEELDTAQRLRFTAELEQQKIRHDREDLEGRKQEILEEARLQGRKILAAAEEKLKQVFSKIPQDDVLPRERAALTRSVRELRDTLPDPLPQGPQQVPRKVDTKEILYVPALGVDAEVASIDAGRVELVAGGKKLRQPITSLRQYQPRRFAEQKKRVPKVRDQVERKAFLPRLVLVGKRVEDAQGLLGRFLDEALLHGEQKLEIVHGAGQGILRKAVREFLAERRDVTVFHAAGPEQGGDNVTMVELRH